MIKKNTTFLKCEFGQNFLDNLYLLAVLGSGFAMVAAEEELAVEQLDPHHRKDEEEQHVHDQDIEHISKQNFAMTYDVQGEPEMLAKTNGSPI